MKILWHTPSLFNSGTVSSFSTYWHFFKSSICNYEPGRLLKFQNKGQDTPQRWHQGKAPRLPCKTKVFLLSWEQVSSDHAQRAHKALMGGGHSASSDMLLPTTTLRPCRVSNCFFLRPWACHPKSPVCHKGVQTLLLLKKSADKDNITGKCTEDQNIGSAALDH